MVVSDAPISYQAMPGDNRGQMVVNVETAAMVMLLSRKLMVFFHLKRLRSVTMLDEQTKKDVPHSGSDVDSRDERPTIEAVPERCDCGNSVRRWRWQEAHEWILEGLLSSYS